MNDQNDMNYFQGEYESYYNDLNGGNGVSSQNLKDTVANVQASISSVTEGLNTWQGSGNESYKEVAGILLDRFK